MSLKNRTKTIALPPIDEQSDIKPRGQLSIDECRRFLNDNSAAYSEEEVKLIRKVLYALVEVDYQYHMRLFRKQATTIISLNTATDDTEKSHSLLPGQHRRTG